MVGYSCVRSEKTGTYSETSWYTNAECKNIEMMPFNDMIAIFLDSHFEFEAIFVKTYHKPNVLVLLYIITKWGTQTISHKDLLI